MVMSATLIATQVISFTDSFTVFASGGTKGTVPFVPFFHFGTKRTVPSVPLFHFGTKRTLTFRFPVLERKEPSLLFRPSRSTYQKSREMESREA
jgi:hypothetical protein